MSMKTTFLIQLKIQQIGSFINHQIPVVPHPTRRVDVEFEAHCHDNEHRVRRSPPYSTYPFDDQIASHESPTKQLHAQKVDFPVVDWPHYSPIASALDAQQVTAITPIQ